MRRRNLYPIWQCQKNEGKKKQNYWEKGTFFTLEKCSTLKNMRGQIEAMITHERFYKHIAAFSELLCGTVHSY